MDHGKEMEDKKALSPPTSDGKGWWCQPAPERGSVLMFAMFSGQLSL